MLVLKHNCLAHTHCHTSQTAGSFVLHLYILNAGMNADSQFLMSDINTASPRIPSPLTAGMTTAGH